MVVSNDTVEMTREEMIAEIDRGARKALGLSAAELARAYRERTLDSPGRVAELIAILNLLPDDDPLFAPRLEHYLQSRRW